MLNYNKIKSDISKRKIDLTEIATFGKLKYSSFRDRYMEKRLYANEIDVISQFFERSIDYYFDREEIEEKEVTTYQIADPGQVVEEPYTCLKCAVLQAEINRLNKDLIESQKETIAALRGETKVTQANCG